MQPGWLRFKQYWLAASRPPGAPRRLNLRGHTHKGLLNKSNAWATVFSRMSDTELSERLTELREIVKLIGLQLRDVNENTDLVIVEQSRR
jgi:hypothetical protein